MTDPLPNALDWPVYLADCARELADVRREICELRKAIDAARVNVLGEGHTQRWQYDAAILATTQELQGQLYEQQRDEQHIVQAILLARLNMESGIPLVPGLDLRDWHHL